MSRPSNKEIRKHLRGQVAKFNHNIRPGLCLWFSQQATGSPHVQPSAAAFGRSVTLHKEPRVGDIAVWTGGSHGYGHAAVVAGHHNGVWHIYTTDIAGAGTVTLQPLSVVHDKWGQTYQGCYTPEAWRGLGPHQKKKG